VTNDLPEKDTDHPAKLADSLSLQKLSRYFSLTLSLPERTARALSAVVGGGTLLLTRTLVPGAIKNSTSYMFTLGMFESFLVRNLAGMVEISADTELKDSFVQRKLLGSSLEAAGLLTMQLSPVWVFAIASDAAESGQVFLQRLVLHLRENQVIAQDSHPETLEQILQSVHEMSRQGATAIDTPPLSLDEVNTLADELRRSTGNLADNYSKLLPHFEALWNQISVVAKKENVSVPVILGMLSVHAASIPELGLGSAGAVGKAGYAILDDVILSDYKQTLQGIAKTGTREYMRAHMAPFMLQAKTHFDLNQENMTQKWFSRAVSKLKEKLYQAG
jgi:hypothetical protein